MANWAYFAGLACLAAAVAFFAKRLAARNTTSGVAILSRKDTTYRYYTLDGEYFRARIGDNGVTEVLYNEDWARYAGDPLMPIALGKRIAIEQLPEKALDLATLLDQRKKVSRQLEVLRARPNPFPSIPDPGDSRPVVGELQQIVAKLDEHIAELSYPERRKVDASEIRKIVDGLWWKPGHSVTGTALGYLLIAMATLGFTVRIALFGTRLPLDSAIIQNGSDALWGLLGVFGVEIGRKLTSFEQQIDRLDAHRFWDGLIRRRFHRIAVPLGCILFACGGGEELASIMFAPRPRSDIRMLVDIAAVSAVLLGSFACIFGRALRKLHNRISA